MTFKELYTSFVCYLKKLEICTSVARQVRNLRIPNLLVSCVHVLIWQRYLSAPPISFLLQSSFSPVYARALLSNGFVFYFYDEKSRTTDLLKFIVIISILQNVILFIEI